MLNRSDLFNKDATGKVNPNGQTLGKTASTVTAMAIPIPVGKTAEVVVDAVGGIGTKILQKVGKAGQETVQGMRAAGQGAELATANGALLGKTSNSIDNVAVQTAEDLNSKIVTVDSNGNPSGTRFRSDYEDHIKQREFSKTSQRSGVNGAHNMKELEQYDIAVNPTLAKNSINIVSKTPHPTVKGIYQIEYKMPVLDVRLNPTGAWRLKSKTDPFVKTVYDSSIISDKQMAQFGREAFADAVQNNAIQPNGKWNGRAPNGLEFEGYVDQNTKAVRTFYPVF